MEVLEPVDASHTPTPDFETDTEDEYAPDGDELAVAADNERTKAKGKGREQDSGKILSCQTHLAYLAYPRKLPHTPARIMRTRSTRRGIATK